jgi:hypothetical protein
MSAAPSGVAATPRYPFDHTKLFMIGHRLSAEATAIAVVTISPGAMYATYDTPPSTASDVGVRSTSGADGEHRARGDTAVVGRTTPGCC